MTLPETDPAPGHLEADRPPTILFLHIPKTGGVTLRSVLSRQFRSETVLEPGFPGGGLQQRLIRYIERGEGELPHNPDRNQRFAERFASLGPQRVGRTRVVLGHLWFGLHEAWPGPATYVTLLRDPVDRVLSLYHHRVTRHRLRLDLGSYVRTGRDIALDNDQTRRLVGRLPGGADVRMVACTDDMLRTAKRNLLQHVAVPGVTERFDETVVALAHRFGFRRLGYASANVSGSRPRRQDVDPEIIGEIERRNRFDAELHRFAGELLDEQLAELPDLPERVARLRRASARYRRVRALVGPVEAPARRVGRVARRVAAGRGLRGPRA